MDVTLRRFSLPLVAPIQTPTGRVERRDGVLVVVDDGETAGVGEASPLSGWTESLEECVAALRSARDALAEGGIDPILTRLASTPAARHGLSLATADLRARREGRPLYRHLGGDNRVTSVPVNATVGRGDVGVTTAAAREAVSEGFRCVKVKLGGRPIDEDVDRLGAVRDAVGPDVALRADANGAWSIEEARQAVDGLAAVGVEYVEQPVAAADLDGLAELRGGPVAVAADESIARCGPRRVVDAGAADVLVVKPMAAGGVERARETIDLAADAGLRSVVSTTVDAAIARAGAVHLAASLADPAPAGLATAGSLAEDLAPDPAPVVDGRARVPAGAGHGVDLSGVRA